jgi:hypothetical protein
MNTQQTKQDDLSGEWECFCDPCYYDLWAVRRTHERAWGQCFHLHSGEEARAITALLNSASALLKAKQAIERDCFTLGENAHAHGADISDNAFGDEGEASALWSQGWFVSAELHNNIKS